MIIHTNLRFDDVIFSIVNLQSIEQRRVESSEIDRCNSFQFGGKRTDGSVEVLVPFLVDDRITEGN